ncbi:MAG TPA: segregation and condensation protein A [Thiolapillus brandeum]|uniref:Segregation and condensation protein A n=1 Tax=Thiolapillus brandeum TaxID=1076588 RepID=A0A831NZB8_9GAMM|nr:segregation and condensation protein A [Thiolapillus brandeum]
MSDDSTKEREILVVMRKVLASVIKDTTPEFKTMKHPLSTNTIEELKMCLSLIAARERELAQAAGTAQSRPYYSDEKVKAEVVPISKIGGLKEKPDDQ